MGGLIGKKYSVTVSTGKARGAGTNATIEITLIDVEDNVTDVTVLDKLLSNDFEYGDKDTYTVKAPKDFGKSFLLGISAGLKPESVWIIAMHTHKGIFIYIFFIYIFKKYPNMHRAISQNIHYIYKLHYILYI